MWGEWVIVGETKVAFGYVSSNFAVFSFYKISFNM